MNDDELLLHLSAMEVQVMQAAGVNAAIIDTLLADDFFEFGRSGKRWDKAGILTMERTAGTHAIARDFALTRLGSEHALLTYTSDASDRGDATLRSSIWSLRDGSWRMVFHQGTKTMQQVGG